MADDDISDAVAASLLKKEATERSLRYSAFGLVAFAGDRKKPHSAPKPNTRFLRSLVKEADSHNAALLAREAEEAKLRLEKLRREDRGCRDRERDSRRRASRSRSRSRSPDRARRKERDRHQSRSRSRSRSKDRRRHRSDRDDGQRKRQKVGIGDIDRLLQAARREKRDGEKGRGERSSKRDDREREKDGRSHRRDSERHRDRHRHRSRSPRERERDKDRDKRERRAHSSSSSSPPDRRRHRSHRSRRSRSTSTSASRSPQKRTRPDYDDDSDDPLAPYLAPPSPQIGPSLPSANTIGTNPRGRGLPGSSAMDRRFDPSYDPSLDVTPSNPAEEDDWDAALEALRDRQRWKQQGRERLKAAGFDDNFIEAWETNTTKDESKIKWSKEKGGRDWDRGKVVDEVTGEVQLKASWSEPRS
ncbi:hypothetical protein TWF696_004052 [Orbilia brochopaga]|uniref:Pre-mRNA-splicing factor 38B n=1 Tax=Orbilia brochopaga TaxID=3140254 RepID=A0AAV9V6Q1_9PEZI